MQTPRYHTIRQQNVSQNVSAGKLCASTTIYWIHPTPPNTCNLGTLDQVRCHRAAALHVLNGCGIMADQGPVQQGQNIALSSLDSRAGRSAHMSWWGACARHGGALLHADVKALPSFLPAASFLWEGIMSLLIISLYYGID